MMFSSSLIMVYTAPCFKELLPFVNDNSLLIRIWKQRGHPCPMDTVLVFNLFMRSEGKCKPCFRAFGFIESVHEKQMKVQAMCQNTRFIESVHEKQMKVQAMCQNTRFIESVHEKQMKVQAMCQNTRFIESVHEKQMKVQAMCQNTRFIESVREKQMKVQAMCQNTRFY